METKKEVQEVENLDTNKLDTDKTEEVQQTAETEDKEFVKDVGRHLKKEILKEIWSWVQCILVALVVAVFLNKFVIINANVPTGSMEETIMPGDRLIGSRLSYMADEPKRGDIIIFEYPINPDEIYIKRVIALPGETIEIRDSKVYINGNTQPITEDYLAEEWVMENDDITYTVPEGHYFVMGDNRNSSLDGRYWAIEAVKEGLAPTPEEAVKQNYPFVSKEAILGKAIFRYYPSFTKM